MNRKMKSPRRPRPLTAPPSVASGANIRVVVRIRPHNQRETNLNARKAIKVLSNNVLMFDPKESSEPFFYHGVQQQRRDISKKAHKNLQFLFDRVFSPELQNTDVFEDSTRRLIPALMDGYNCSVFVYGATGAGKTHTMLGSTDNPGITFLTMSELFARINELRAERDFELGITYLEVYNENVHDLLNPGKALYLRDDGKFGVVVAGICVKTIEEPHELFKLLEEGNRNRTQHPTDANAESSRSHAVFQVYLRMSVRTTGEVRTAKLSMIDLAGSERGSATGCTGARFTEGANINKSLLALGNCINSLADGQRHVPYRDSKLTRILKDSLGGNCQTVMIANVAPSCLNYEDTYNTLKYAMRAKKIKSNMRKNVIASELNVAHYVKMVEALQQQRDQLLQQYNELKVRFDAQQNSTTAQSHPQTSDDETSALEELYRRRKQLEKRIDSLVGTARLYEMRRTLKTEVDARLSGLCPDTPQKQVGHRRFGKTIDKLKKSVELIDEEIVGLRAQKGVVEMDIAHIVNAHPSLSVTAKIGDLEIAHLKAEEKAHYLEKMFDFQSKELRMRDQLLERITQFVQPCFMQLRGHGYATDAIIANYEDLLRHVQGLRSVTFSGSDSGISSTTTDTDTNGDEETTTTMAAEETRAQSPPPPPPTHVTALKRKLIDENSPLDHTFVKHQSPKERRAQPNLTLCADQLMVKVYKPSPAKKVVRAKENATNGRPILLCNRSRVNSLKIKPSRSKPLRN